MRKVTAAGIALALMASTSVMAQTVKHDTTIAKAAAAKAAEKIGVIRGSIDNKENPEIITKEALAAREDKVSLVPSYNVEPTSQENDLPPLTSIFPGVDKTVTGSVRPRKSAYKRRVIWDKFDRYGNPIE